MSNPKFLKEYQRQKREASRRNPSIYRFVMFGRLSYLCVYILSSIVTMLCRRCNCVVPKTVNPNIVVTIANIQERINSTVLTSSSPVTFLKFQIGIGYRFCVDKCDYLCQGNAEDGTLNM